MRALGGAPWRGDGGAMAGRKAGGGGADGCGGGRDGRSGAAVALRGRRGMAGAGRMGCAGDAFFHCNVGQNRQFESGGGAKRGLGWSKVVPSLAHLFARRRRGTHCSPSTRFRGRIRQGRRRLSSDWRSWRHLGCGTSRSSRKCKSSHLPTLGFEWLFVCHSWR